MPESVTPAELTTLREAATDGIVAISELIDSLTAEVRRLNAENADYAFLVEVRETWGYLDRCGFQGALNGVWAGRCQGIDLHNLSIHYQPGDYSKAATAALEVKP